MARRIMRHATRLAFVGISLLLAACMQTGLAVLNLPTHVGGGNVVTDIPFGPGDWQRLDIYQPPAGKALATKDVIVFLYGGRWESGSRAMYRFVGSTLAKRGYVVVIPDYRKYPDVKFPTFVEDAAAAVAWTHRGIGTYGADPDRIAVIGHSAGAHIGSLVAADPQYLKRYGEDRSVVRRFIGLAGPYDFTPEDEDLKDMFGPPDRYPEMRTTSYVDGKQPPMLLLRGADDTTVAAYNADRLESSVLNKGGCVQKRVYPGIDHIGIIVRFSWLRQDTRMLGDIDRFIAAGCDDQATAR